MRNNPVLAFTLFSVLLLIIDGYSFWGIRKIIHDYSLRLKRIITILFWIVPPFLLFGIIFLTVMRESIPASQTMPYFHFFSGTFILFYVPKLIFILFNIVDDIIFPLRKIITGVRHHVAPKNEERPTITRRKFLNQVGIIFAGIPFLSLIYGIALGRFNFTVRNLSLKFDNLPDKFDGLKIVQISDFHLGSFINNEDEVRHAIDLVNAQEPDIILFTGDLVNNVAEEIDGFFDILKSLKAKKGKYSILGNHDYGEYVRWSSDEKKKMNLQRVIEKQKEMDFDLLLNESRSIAIDEQKIDLIGVENWGLPPFPQYGDLKKSMQNTDKDTFKILLSHDPTHWDAQVLNKTDIDLTLSGHTHGAQFGIEIPGWRWSPVSLRYKRWGGLYEEAKQKLYVNTGIGFIGFPGRVGMPPEITVFELRRA